MTDSNDILFARETELRRQLHRLLELIDAYRHPAEALELELQLTRIVGQWRTLLVLRDRDLYRPATRGDRARAAVAVTCRERMDALAEQVEDFARRWSSSALITIAFPSFRAMALMIVAAITARLDVEQRAFGNPAAVGASLAA